MKKLVTAASLILYSLSVHAIPVNGYTDLTNNGDGTYTFTFDTLPGPDRDGNSDGLLFSGLGIDLTVTGSSTVRQDVPSNGGLGVLGSTNGDNLDSGVEWLNFTFNQDIDLVNVNFNGTLYSDGHTDLADGFVAITSGGSGYGFDAFGLDGIAPEYGFTLDEFDPLIYTSINTFLVGGYSFPGSDDFHGYVESVTFRANVPEPSVLALLAAGLLGLGLTRRRKLI